MELHVVIKGRKDLASQLYQQLREAIESGRLATGARLPPSRLLAEQLGISRKTVSDTYSLLTYENYLVGKIGSGTFVNARLATKRPKQSRSDFASAELIQHWQDLQSPIRHPAMMGTSRCDFIGGATNRLQFPEQEWRRCTQYALRQIARSPGFYSQPEGLPALREAIAQHVSFSRGVVCVDSDIVVCNGAQQALDLISRVLIQPGNIVAMEDPGYTPARLLFSAQGANVVGIPVDSEGICVELIPDGTRLIYVTPSHQFPLGMPMSQARREALLERARELGAVIIEDDYDSEFRYEGRPTDSLQSMDELGIVAYVGTFSKTLLPQLRLGYAVLPPAIIEAVIIAKQLTDWHTSTLPQWALAKFISDGYLLKHIRRCHGIYAGRRERLLSRVHSDLAPWFVAVPSMAGFHMALLCKVPIDIARLIERAKKADIGLYSLAPFFYATEEKPGLLMGFGAIETLDIDPSLDRLKSLLEAMA
ncbi:MULTISPECIES: PLP-dependent aminotransferase family protein [unclassified Pseudomonas]|uniref:MocR-like pyridoxine biosynthesis transcription factor PdxR n=1 Tax=unclassified Pseudomonas TaxID=196821 RepID=UPI002AC8BA1E|nr:MULTISPECIES: PLP-dependent aminotransferase family protein [unclassified Pseudomonas]MEB0041456.1 PLP-dependent aminotransferase family protein [Pseudomonas sp. MH10]MEB0121935.1 PLP-dependent aminotransferase family protein [Pseudomonas sp. CCI1.2]WPX64456.1 PLP-dependent aminotransferase family protein [Pseudomonas sp. MH10]